MIFAAILKANKVLQKNVVNRTFFTTTVVGLILTLFQNTIQADLISIPLLRPVNSGIFYDTSYFGISSSNTLTKYSVTGQHLWSTSLDIAPVKKLHAAFNRLAILNENGNLECRDSIFGIRLWKSELSHIHEILFQYPISYARLTTGAIIPFDFNSGVPLGQLAPATQNNPLKGILSSTQGVTLLGKTTISELGIEQPETTVTTTLEEGYQVLSLSPRQIIAMGDLIVEKQSTKNIPLFAMGGPTNNIYFYKTTLINITPNSSNRSQSEWIVAPPYLIEVAIGYSMIRIINIETMDIVLEWKEIDPDRHWKSIWWDNGLLAVLDMNQTLTIWDSASKRTLGSVSWDLSNDSPLGMIYTHDVLSFVSTNSIYYAFSRK